MANNSKSIAILGAGKLGVTLAQLALTAGYTVYISGSGTPEKIRLSMKVLAPGAIVTSSENAVRHTNLVILAMPLGKYKTIPKDILAGKLVIDSMNYWWEVDGEREDLRNLETSTSETVQSYFSSSRVVKALSHMGYHHLSDGAATKGSSERKAIAIAGDNLADSKNIAIIVDDLGFDPLIIGDLATGKQLQPGYIAFGANVDRETLKSYFL